MKMVKYYCDRCNKEINKGEDVIKIHIEAETDVKKFLNTNAEICEDCYDSINILLMHKELKQP